MAHNPNTQQETSMDDNFLDTREAAQIVRLSHRTLEKFRITGEGPEFYKLGRRTFYTRATIAAWANNLRRKSTADKEGLGAR